MRSGTARADFREAAGHEHELNERQREVLALVAKGLTNAQIGERLGMTLDGAKWNVSEILTKLGLASREEAAEYWRWRHGSVWSRVRGWLGAPLLKIAGAGAATILAVGFVAALSSEDEPPLVAQWVLEGTFSNRREGAHAVMEPPEAADRGVMRWIWVDDSHWRWEVRYETRRDGTADTFAVADGEFIHFYEAQSNWHYRIPIAALPEGWSAMLGSMASGPFRQLAATSIDAYISKRKIDQQPDSFITTELWKSGTADVLGIPTEIIESTPSWANSEFRTSGGIRREWVEPNHLLVVKSTSEGNDGSEQSRSEITSLRFDVPLKASELVFHPPPGSCDMGEGTPRRPDQQIPQGVPDVDEWLREQRCGKAE
jgi:DNA-binding CsgD family transcriptional regulator